MLIKYFTNVDYILFAYQIIRIRSVTGRFFMNIIYWFSYNKQTPPILHVLSCKPIPFQNYNGAFLLHIV